MIRNTLMPALTTIVALFDIRAELELGKANAVGLEIFANRGEQIMTSPFENDLNIESV